MYDQVLQSAQSTARVAQQNGQVYLVDLAAATCSYQRYQVSSTPCDHALALIFCLGREIGPFLPASLSIST